MLVATVVDMKGHFARDQSCPALKATCIKCHNQGHFANMCKTQKVNSLKLNPGRKAKATHSD